MADGEIESAHGACRPVDDAAAGPKSHRRPGRASIKGPTTPTFREEAWENPREVLLVFIGGWLGVGWGMSTALADGSAASRALGAAAAVAGVLVWVSYVVRFLPGALQGELWTSTRPRRALRGTLRYAWVVFVVAYFLTWAVTLFADS